MQEEKEVKEVKEWTFHSKAKTHEVYDPIKKGTIADFQNHICKTSDPELAKALKARGYEEWALFTEDDMVELVTGESVRLGDLPKAIAHEFIGKPKKVAQDFLSKITSPLKRNKDENDPPPGDLDEEPPLVDNQCPSCKKIFETPSGLNGHFAHCKTKDPEVKE